MSFGYAAAFHQWLAREHAGGFTYPDCDWRTPTVRSRWVYLSGPIAGLKVQQRDNPSVFGIVTDVKVVWVGFRMPAMDITVECEGRSLAISRADFNQHWWTL